MYVFGWNRLRTVSKNTRRSTAQFSETFIREVTRYAITSYGMSPDMRIKATFTQVHLINALHTVIATSDLDRIVNMDGKQTVATEEEAAEQPLVSVGYHVGPVGATTYGLPMLDGGAVLLAAYLAPCVPIET